MLHLILVAEDYPDARELMRLLLEADGYQVVEAADGAEAVFETSRTNPHLILMDISMPMMNGIEATVRIRALTDDCKNTPIIAITAHGEQYKESALAAGCNELIGKPVDFERLNALLKRYLTA